METKPSVKTFAMNTYASVCLCKSVHVSAKLCLCMCLIVQECASECKVAPVHVFAWLSMFLHTYKQTELDMVVLKCVIRVALRNVILAR